MNGHGSKLGRKKEQAILVLLENRTIADAARIIGVGTRTLQRWRRLPEFEEEYRRARQEAWAQAMGRLQQTSGPAVALLLRVILDPSAPTASRVRTAIAVVEMGAKMFELENLEMRLARLEKLQEEKK